MNGSHGPDGSFEPDGSHGSRLARVDRLAVLSGAVDGLVTVAPGSLGESELAAHLIGLRREMDRLEAVFAGLTRAAHVRGVGLADGAASTAAWLRHRTGMREGDARAAMEAGAACELLPEMDAAWRTGEIGSGAARTIVAARVDGHDEQYAACEGAFMELARAGDLRGLRTATAHFRNRARADCSEPRIADGLHLSKTYGSRTVLAGEFGDAAAEALLTAIHGYTDPPDPDDPRSGSQRRADALVRICDVAVAALHQDPQRPVAHLTCVVDWATLTEGRLGRCDGAFTGPIHPDDIRRLLCDSSVSRVVTGPAGEPLDVGRSRRTVPPPLRRALVVRDRGCRYPGCGRPPGWCDAHHLRHWAEGGATALWNLLLLCDHHHHVVHQAGWIVYFDGPDLVVVRPDGRRVT